ncbi:hypothetical protein HYC85_018093 [Camellia sinensis]|uniref:Uncharacterized protein n=1 Tax=Camellia sinensis TaxID=4442 RepID=A0A7J7GWZ2_CAMSI|nr:hypothetical protein HYC85_018093 [Camellia sinensis]
MVTVSPPPPTSSPPPPPLVTTTVRIATLVAALSLSLSLSLLYSLHRSSSNGDLKRADCDEKDQAARNINALETRSEDGQFIFALIVLSIFVQSTPRSSPITTLHQICRFNPALGSALRKMFGFASVYARSLIIKRKLNHEIKELGKMIFMLEGDEDYCNQLCCDAKLAWFLQVVEFALTLQEAGCFSVVLEYVLALVATAATSALRTPTIDGWISSLYLCLIEKWGLNRRYVHRLRNYRSVTTVHELECAGRIWTVAVESYVVDVPDGNTEEDTRLFADTIVRLNLQKLASVTKGLARDGDGKSQVM